MSNYYRRSAQTASVFICTLIAFLSTFAIAQSSFDLDPPTIAHTVPSAMTIGKPLRVNAIVTDDSGIEDVIVHYRAGQSGEYQAVSMINVQGSEYTALLSTTKDQKSIRYYIEAIDSSGNRVVEASPQSPLIVSAKKKSNVLYILLGAVAVGALVGAAGGGGSSGGSGDSGTRVLSISAGVPD